MSNYASESETYIPVPTWGHVYIQLVLKPNSGQGSVQGSEPHHEVDEYGSVPEQCDGQDCRNQSRGTPGLPTLRVEAEHANPTLSLNSKYSNYTHEIS